MLDLLYGVVQIGSTLHKLRVHHQHLKSKGSNLAYAEPAHLKISRANIFLLYFEIV